ncbi:sulfatase [Haloferax larsenii]|uniref:Arylsulfatase A n=1 Tax=Haloferax larsenii TaxID=302484 RepID=A0A1H7PXS1_HALLR|nr:sulfatase [Haloferax larsenii]SEL40376.1 Arylsulfatase A [Haloferax larsenii]
MTTHGELPSVLWITLDSVRHDYTSLGTPDRETTPNLQAIAARDDAVSFDSCFAHAHWTPSSSASILTGRRVSSHGIGFADTTQVAQLPDNLTTVGERFSRAGYNTACFSTNPYLGPVTGLDRGFDVGHWSTSHLDMLSGAGMRTALKYLLNVRKLGGGFSLSLRDHFDPIHPRYQTEVVKGWIRKLSRDGPFFIYNHINSTHHPYNPPVTVLRRYLAGTDLTAKEAIRTARAITDDIWGFMAEERPLTEREKTALVAVYEAEIAYHDTLVAELYQYAMSLDTPVIVVITADHGELFGEQGVVGHNLLLSDGIVHVPLVVSGLPGLESRGDDIVQHIDVMQTVLESVGADASGFEGANLLKQSPGFAIAERGPRPSNLEAIRTKNSLYGGEYMTDALAMLRTDTWKLLRNGDDHHLYRLPDEETDLARSYPDVVETLSEILDERVGSSPAVEDAGATAEYDPETLSRLESLGYL